MTIAIKMPALSPTMEEGTLAKWLVKEGDSVKSGDIMAEIETDKATMEFEATDEGVIARILIAEGTDGVKVGADIALLAEEGEKAARAMTPKASEATPADPGSSGRPGPADPAAQGDAPPTSTPADKDDGTPAAAAIVEPGPATGDSGARVSASPLARRLATAKGVDLATLVGTGENGRIVRSDVVGAREGAALPNARPEAEATAAGPDAAATAAPTPAARQAAIPDIPHTAAKLSNIRKTIARRLTESKQTVPHIYLTVDVRLDTLLGLRADLNDELVGRGVKLSVNDLIVKALAVALVEVSSCNVMFTPDQLISFARADISVAVSTPTGLVTPVIVDAAAKPVSAISNEMKELAGLARDGKLKPEQYQGGTASLSNMGMYGITQFDAVINPPQGMIMAVGAGEKRPWIMSDGSLGVASVMSATGSFDHRAIDGAEAAQLMQAFKRLVEAPLAMLA